MTAPGLIQAALNRLERIARNESPPVLSAVRQLRNALPPDAVIVSRKLAETAASTVALYDSDLASELRRACAGEGGA